MIELEEAAEKNAPSPTIRSMRKASPAKHSPQKSIATPSKKSERQKSPSP